MRFVIFLLISLLEKLKSCLTIYLNVGDWISLYIALYIILGGFLTESFFPKLCQLPVLSYQEALKKCNIATLYQRRQLLTERLFSEIKDNTCHKLHGLLPSCNLSTVALRRKRAFNVPFCRTNRLKNSFIMYNAAIS